MKIDLIGAPVDSGKKSKGCLMGPDAYRTANLARALRNLGHEVKDLGNLRPDQVEKPDCANPAVHSLAETIGWTKTLARVGEDAIRGGRLPVFMGGDHSLSLGSVTGVAAATDRPQFVLWLDAHSDFHTLLTTESGNLHGTPLAYITGRDGFDGFPEVKNPVPEKNVCIIGLRSVDGAEREFLEDSDIRYHDMREIDENGISVLLRRFLNDINAVNGVLHVSLDVDFLDPAVAPAVGTTVPGGATVREGHLCMEMIHDSGLMTSLDLVELNPFLDERGRTAQVMVDLAASALGRRVFDRPTRAYLS